MACDLLEFFCPFNFLVRCLRLCSQLGIEMIEGLDICKELTSLSTLLPHSGKFIRRSWDFVFESFTRDTFIRIGQGSQKVWSSSAQRTLEAKIEEVLSRRLSRTEVYLTTFIQQIDLVEFLVSA